MGELIEFSFAIILTMKALAFAMDREAKPLLDSSRITASYKYGFAKIYEGEFMNTKYVAVVSGIGKVFSAAGITTLIEHCAPESIVNVGICASLEPQKAPLFSCLIGKSFIQHDFDTTSFGDPKGMLPGIKLVEVPTDKRLLGDLKKTAKREKVPFYIGKIATGDQFIDNASRILYIKTSFDVCSVDMESGAMAQVCYAYGIPFGCLRVVSDSGNSGEYESNSEKAIEVATTLAKQYLILD